VRARWQRVTDETFSRKLTDLVLESIANPSNDSYQIQSINIYSKERINVKIRHLMFTINAYLYSNNMFK